MLKQFFCQAGIRVSSGFQLENRGAIALPTEIRPKTFPIGPVLAHGIWLLRKTG
jgi:hypothetical protein